jgi:hypothetical protein
VEALRRRGEERRRESRGGRNEEFGCKTLEERHSFVFLPRSDFLVPRFLSSSSLRVLRASVVKKN